MTQRGAKTNGGSRRAADFIKIKIHNPARRPAQIGMKISAMV